MAQRGAFVDTGATACPFVALELDRDRRSERPDYRHRCYAEPTPAPRTIAHQERYCLSPNFPGCPIFQDWAVRAAARPVPLPAGHEGRRGPDPRAPEGAGLTASGMAAGAGMGGAAGMAESEVAAAASSEIPEFSQSAVQPSAQSPAPEPLPPAAEPWPDSMGAPEPLPPVGSSGSSGSSGTDDDYFDRDAAQLSAFDAPALAQEPPLTEDPLPPASAAATRSPFERPLEPDPALRPTTPMAEAPVEDADGAAVPAFLAGRASRPRPPAKMDDRVAREDVVPSWEIDGRFGAQAADRPDRPSMFSRLLTVVAVVLILALGVLAVILVPGLLNGPGGTPRPSVARPSTLSSGLASPGASLIAVEPSASVARPTPTATTAEPTDEPTLAPSPITYRIKAGDTLAKVARKHDITVEELLAANPQITNPDHIEVGQVVFIPLPTTTPAP